MNSIAQPWKIGDVVQLKSGGPQMTVTQVQPDLVGCQWFAGTETKFGSFPTEALQAYQRTAPRAMVVGMSRRGL